MPRAASPGTPSRPPYPGLLSFQDEDAAIFFGRDDDIRRLIERLNARRVRAAPNSSRSSARPGPASRRCCGPASCRGLSATGATGSSAAVPPAARSVGRTGAPPLASAGGRRAEWRDLARSFRSARSAGARSATRADLRVARKAPTRRRSCSRSTRRRSCSRSPPTRGGAALLCADQAGGGRRILPFTALLALRSDYPGAAAALRRARRVPFEEFSLGPMPLDRVRADHRGAGARCGPQGRGRAGRGGDAGRGDRGCAAAARLHAARAP